MPFGRLVIPKRVRDDLGLKPGAVLRVEQDDQRILMEPVPEEPQLLGKNGVSVFTGTATGDIPAAMQAHRQERLGEVSSGMKR